MKEKNDIDSCSGIKKVGKGDWRCPRAANPLVPENSGMSGSIPKPTLYFIICHPTP